MTEAEYNTGALDLHEGDTVPLQIDSAGNLKVNVATGSGGGPTAAQVGAVNETAPANDTASSGLNGRLQRIAQRITSLIALVPASLGAKAASASFAVTQSTEDAAQLGSLTETAPATDTASSGLNGRLQRVAQRLTSLIAFWVAATGTKTSVNSGVASVTILAANAARKGAMFKNTDANILYLDLSGGTASATSYSVDIAPGGFYELPSSPLYTGLITGIWAADGSGAALVTEFS